MEQGLKHYEMFIGGTWAPAADGDTIETIDPYAIEPWATIPRGRKKDADRAISAAYEALHSPRWTRLTATQRGALLRRLAELIERDRDRLGDVETRDNDKIIAETRGITAYAAQIFRPVLAVIPFDAEADAIRLANDTDYGLAGGVWSKDFPKALRVAEAVEVGTVWINNYRLPSMVAPFGGFKRSGIGRENGFAGIREFLRTKTIWIDTGNEIADPFAARL